MKLDLGPRSPAIEVLHHNVFSIWDDDFMRGVEPPHNLGDYEVRHLAQRRANLDWSVRTKV